MKKNKIVPYKIKSKLNKKIVLLTDIHYYSKKDKKILDKIVDDVKSIKPDYICISGDLIETSAIKEEEYLLSFLRQLSIIAITLISLGNHDVRDLKQKQYSYNLKLFEKIEKTGCYLLDNKVYKDEFINVKGVTIPDSFYYEGKEEDVKIKDYLKKQIKKNYDIVLIHTPNVIPFLEKQKDTLFLFGHMHGGMLPSFLNSLFKTRGLISPRKGLFPKYCYGYIKEINGIISSGIQKISPLNPFYLFHNLYKGNCCY